jgi:hypothetical protein
MSLRYKKSGCVREKRNLWILKNVSPLQKIRMCSREENSMDFEKCLSVTKNVDVFVRREIYGF